VSRGTAIEWTDVTWNPVRGCSRVSEGCRNCYAERFAARFSRDAFRDGMDHCPAGPFQGFARNTTNGPRWTGKVALIPEKLAEPLRWRKPRRVFVNSMSDLFHESLSDRDVAKVFSAMRFAPRHTFQVLTKRPARMLEWFSKCGNGGGLGWITHNNTEPEKAYRGTGVIVGESDRWPLPNVHLGVSVENQATAELRILDLLNTPAAVRYVSYEPALALVDFTRLSIVPPKPPYGPGVWLNALTGHVEGPDDVLPRLDWLIIGGESGPRARPMDLAWARKAVRQAKEAGIPVFVKQLGTAWARERGIRWHSQHAYRWNANRKGGNPSEWPEDLRVREFPSSLNDLEKQ